MLKEKKLHLPCTKIVATLGPASQDVSIIEKLAEEGVSVFRLNFSHGEHEQHAKNAQAVRSAEKKIGRSLSIMADLQGPKIRIGTFVQDKVILKAGNRFSLCRDAVAGDETQVTLPHPDLFHVFTAGEDILINDGRIRLRIEESDNQCVQCRVIVGGELSERKGVNIPGLLIPVSVLSEKDKRDLDFALNLNVDWIAVSFVQQAKDVEQVRAIVGDRASILAKLEKPVAIEHHLDDILDVADAVMVARGDLGVEVPPERVPAMQKRIVHACRLKGRPVIVATQMLESMTQSPVPTRAEASDVATALYDGADAVMLSAETATGSFPIESVGTMKRIVMATENDPGYWRGQSAVSLPDDASTNDVIARAAVEVAEHSLCVAIVTFTSTGSTAIRASRVRSSIPIVSLTPKLSTARRLAMVWGVETIFTSDVSSVDEMDFKAQKEILGSGGALVGDRIVVTAGVPFGTPGTTNLIRLTIVQGGIHDKDSLSE